MESKKANKLNIYNDYLLKKISTEELLQQANLSFSDDVINVAISDETFNDIVKRIQKNMKSKNIDNVDLIIGGVPALSSLFYCW